MSNQTAELERKDEAAASLATEPREPGPIPGRRVLPGADLPRIVVVGGGAGGLELVTRLGDRLGKRQKAAIRLVERERVHMWKPLLHEVAAGSLDVDEHGLDYLAHAHWHHYRYRFGEMIGLDRTGKQVLLAPTFDDEGREITPRRTVRYNILVLAIGSVTNDFGTPGVKEHAIALETPEDAERFNRRLVNALMRAHTQAEPVRPGQLHVAIIGAGATGTELSAELHRTARQVVAYGLDKIDPDKDIRITLIEAAPRILPGLPERISEATTGLLKNLGVDVCVDSKVSEVRADGVALANGRFIPAELTIWAAGVRGPDVLKNLDDLEVSRSNQLVVLPTLQTTRDPDIFAIGDCAFCAREGHPNPVPPRAQAAHQQASHMVKQVELHLRGEPLKPFIYRDFGSLVSLGEYSTVGNLMGFVAGKSMLIEGYFARLMYQSLYKMHQTALHGMFKTAMSTLGRMITRQTEPRVKLH
jgi:NADH dehydrogenase